MTERAFESRLRITKTQIQEFADASGDLNPLHVSEAYARNTPFGGVLAHGVLAFLVGAAAIGESLDDAVGVTLRFFAPVLPETTVTAEARQHGERRGLLIRDGSRQLLEARMTVVEGLTQLPERSCIPSFPLSEALDVVGDRLDRHLTIGPYWPDVERIRGILADVGPVAFPSWLVVQLCSVSYVAGMVFPGKSALLRTVGVERPEANHAPLELSIEPPRKAAVDRGLAKLEISAALFRADSAHRVPAWQATGTAGIRRIPVRSAPTARHDKPLQGRTALVVGGSRGLGAALTENLIERGCRTYVLQRSQSDAAPSDPLLSRFTADATDRRALATVRGEIEKLSGGLDYVFLNATGVLHRMRLDSDHIERIADYVLHESVLALAPLAIFAPVMNPGGTCVFSSSQALTLRDDGSLAEEWVDWPHYVAAKSAIEGIISAARLEFPRVRFVVARLPPIDTNLSPRSHVATGLDAGILADCLLEAWTNDQQSPYDRLGPTVS